MPAIKLSELTPEAQKRLRESGVTKRRSAPSISKHEVRTYAIRVMNVIADLTPTERKRVLTHALKLNEV